MANLQFGNSDAAVMGVGGGANSNYLDIMMQPGFNPNTRPGGGAIDDMWSPRFNGGQPIPNLLGGQPRQQQQPPPGGKQQADPRMAMALQRLTPQMQQVLAGGGQAPARPMPASMGGGGGMGGPGMGGGAVPPGGGGGMGGAPQGSAVVDPRMAAAVSKLVKQPAPARQAVIPPGGGAPGNPGGGGVAAPKNPGGGGSQLSGTTDFWETFFGDGKAKYPPGMEPYLKEYFKKSMEVLNTKAPNYKGDRVANETRQLDFAKDAMNKAGTRAMNPDKRWESSVAKHLDPTDYTTSAAANRYAKPVVIPGAVGNSGGAPGNPGGQQPRY